MESSVTSIGPSSNSPVDIGASGGEFVDDGAGIAGEAGSPDPAETDAAKTDATTGDVAAATTGSAGAPAGSAFASMAAIAARFNAGRVPVSPASRLANVSSLSTGTSMVSGITRGAEMR